MSKINITDLQFEPDGEDEFDEAELNQSSNRKNINKYKARKRIEYLMEKKKLREMLDMEDDY